MKKLLYLLPLLIIGCTDRESPANHNGYYTDIQQEIGLSSIIDSTHYIHTKVYVRDSTGMSVTLEYNEYKFEVTPEALAEIGVNEFNKAKDVQLKLDSILAK